MEAAFNQRRSQINPKSGRAQALAFCSFIIRTLSTKILVALIFVLELQFYLPKGLTMPRSSRYNPRNLSGGARPFHTCNVRYFVCIFLTCLIRKYFASLTIIECSGVLNKLPRNSNIPAFPKSLYLKGGKANDKRIDENRN